MSFLEMSGVSECDGQEGEGFDGEGEHWDYVHRHDAELELSAVLSAGFEEGDLGG